jgi:hypothetical protein
MITPQPAVLGPPQFVQIESSAKSNQPLPCPSTGTALRFESSKLQHQGQRLKGLCVK